MALIATSTLPLSSVIAHEYEPAMGYCREVVDVVVPAGGLKLGAVLDASGALVTVANTANAAYVLIDDRVKDFTTAGTFKMLVLARGPVMLKDYGLSYAADVDTDAEKAAVAAVLKAKGMVVVKAL